MCESLNYFQSNVVLIKALIIGVSMQTCILLCVTGKIDGKNIVTLTKQCRKIKENKYYYLIDI